MEKELNKDFFKPTILGLKKLGKKILGALIVLDGMAI